MTLALFVMYGKNMAKMMSVLLVLVMIGAIIPASHSVSCYSCYFCEEPYSPSSSSATCSGKVCAKAKVKKGGQSRIQLFKLLLRLNAVIFLTYKMFISVKKY